MPHVLADHCAGPLSLTLRPKEALLASPVVPPLFNMDFACIYDGSRRGRDAQATDTGLESQSSLAPSSSLQEPSASSKRIVRNAFARRLRQAGLRPASPPSNNTPRMTVIGFWDPTVIKAPA